MTRTAPVPRFGRTPHLVGLVAEAERLVGRLRAVSDEPRARLAAERTDEAVLATLRLDGSPLEELPDPEQAPVGEAPPAPAGATAHRPGTWLDALRAFDDHPDVALQALEVLGVRAALGSEDLADRLLVDPVPTLGELHRRLTHGLVAADRGGAPRTTDQAVHDASTGRVVYFTSDPGAVPAQLATLGSWLASSGAREHALIVSGIVHVELLRIHPFDAANGRLARTTARLLLRSGGLDPDGLACPEPALAADPLGYHEEVASTRRRRDATIWLERWSEAVTAGLRASARRLGAVEDEAPGRAVAFLAGLDEDTFTVVDYRAGAPADPREARSDLQALLDAGVVERVPGSRGLRFRRRHPVPAV